MKKISVIFSYLMVGGLIWCCNTPAESKQNSDARITKAEPTITVTPEVDMPRPASDLTELCNQLDEIRKFPGRDASEEEDPFYASIIAKGKDIMPCLIEQITDETPMHDPRSAPVWQHYKVGDTAIFLLARMTRKSEILKEMLPPAYRKEWKTNGVYAYFNYVSESKNRKELQNWWRKWTKENSNSDQN